MIFIRMVIKRSGRLRRRHANALLQGIADFLLGDKPDQSVEPTHLPKRFTIYEPMLLLPPTFTNHSSAWKLVYDGLTQEERTQLFSAIAAAFRQNGHNITHIAMNAPIAPTINESEAATVKDNVMRSPVHLQDLYGDFGPTELIAADSSQPTQEDFEAAFWVETSQLTGIKQVWAPRWSMFSRGNVREKARILALAEQNPSPFPGFAEPDLGESIARIDVVDMYVGIGYFAISYLKRGVRRVFGWDINAWSIEALRRGCIRNGFECEVVKLPHSVDITEVERIAEHVTHLLTIRPNLRCVAFLGDNKTAGDIMMDITTRQKPGVAALSVRHCNLGLLPTSEGSWEEAVKAIDALKGGWLHVHENTDIRQVEQKRSFVQSKIQSVVSQFKSKDWMVKCEHTEMVKTYAPGVGHFVFDIWIGPSTSSTQKSMSVS